MVGFGLRRSVFSQAHRFRQTHLAADRVDQGVADAKRVLYAAFELVAASDVDRESIGVLVDEEFGADIALRARSAGVALAMPVERSGQAEFDFEFGHDFGQHIEVKTSDELEELATQFNFMAGELHQSYSQLEQKVSENREKRKSPFARPRSQ